MVNATQVTIHLVHLLCQPPRHLVVSMVAANVLSVCGQIGNIKILVRARDELVQLCRQER